MTPTVAPSAASAAYRRRVDILRSQYASLPAGEPVRLSKRTSNLFRPRVPTTRPGLDVSAFDGVIDIDVEARTADVQGMTTYEHLVDATLSHGLMPAVVPQLKTITLGGAITGLGIESSSWREGMPHESMLELDILTGDGRVVTARPEGEHADLFSGFPNSYGTLGYALRAKIDLQPVEPFVHLRHLRFGSIQELLATLEAVCAEGTHGGEAVAFVDGVVFGPDECYLTLGSWAASAPEVSDYTWTEIYYRSLQARSEDWLTTRDYLWRWDTDWFWCSRAFGVQRRWVRRLLGPDRLRSDTYWKIMALEGRWHVKARLDRWRHLPEREDVIQDVEVPADQLTVFVEGFLREVPILPLWLCPLQARRSPVPIAGGPRTWDLYTMDPETLYVNVGFWSSVPVAPGMDPGHHNRWVEREVDRLGGRKSLYSRAFYGEEQFWLLYNGSAYRKLKSTYDPDGRLLDLYAKCVAGL